MSEKQMVGKGYEELTGPLKDMFRQLEDGSLTPVHVQALVEHRNPFAITDIRQEWQEFYRKYFRMTVDFSDIVIPADPGGFDRVIIIAQGLTMGAVVKVLRKQFRVYLYTENLDKDVAENVRTPKAAYAIRVRERQEADEELKNLSANQLKEQGLHCMTLLERLIYEFKYWSETGQHLDVSNWTLCSGSRSSGGRVPSVRWDSGDGRLQVRWFDPGGADDSLRARQAVS